MNAERGMGGRARNRAARRARATFRAPQGRETTWIGGWKRTESFWSAGRAGVANDVAGARRTIVAVDLIILGDADAHREQRGEADDERKRGQRNQRERHLLAGRQFVGHLAQGFATVPPEPAATGRGRRERVID